MDINWVAVIGAAFVNMVVGFLWYGPIFGKSWMALSGMTKEKMESSKGDMPRVYALMFLASIVEAYVLLVFLKLTNSLTLSSALMTAFWIWGGFIATVMLTGYLFGGKKVNLYLIDAGYQLAGFLAMALVLSYF